MGDLALQDISTGVKNRGPTRHSDMGDTSRSAKFNALGAKVDEGMQHVEVEIEHLEALMKHQIKVTRHMFLLAMLVIVLCVGVATTVVFTREVHVQDGTFSDGKGNKIGAASAVHKSTLDIDTISHANLESVRFVQMEMEAGHKVGFAVTRFVADGDDIYLFGADGMAVKITAEGIELVPGFAHSAQTETGLLPAGLRGSSNRRLWGSDGWFWSNDDVEAEAPASPPAPTAAPTIYTNTYESPRDVLHLPDDAGGALAALVAKNNPAAASGSDEWNDYMLREWLDSQHWSSFMSDAGRPGSRDTKNVRIAWVRAEGPGTKGTLLFVVGHTEAVEKHEENILAFIEAGYSPVYAFDHRGQGQSSRLIEEDSYKSHVEKSADFIADMRTFVDVEMPADLATLGLGSQDKFLACHSMGCAVSFTWLIDEYEAQRPVVFSAVAANAPLIKPFTDPFPYSVAVGIGTTMVSLGLGEWYAPTKGKTLDEHWALTGFPTASTQSLTRWEQSRSNCLDHKDVDYPLGGPTEFTGLCIGDVTGGFAAEFFGMYDRFEEFASGGGKLSIPVLLQQAGADTTVLAPPQNTFCDDSCDSCTLTRYETSRHNIWWEIDSIRDAALAETSAFFDSHGTGPTAQNALPPAPPCPWYKWWC